MAPTKRAESRRWVWAVDPFHESPSDQWRAVASLQALYPDKGLAVQPVSCLFPGQFDPWGHRFLHRWHDLAGAAEHHLEPLLAKEAGVTLLAPRLLKQEGPSRSAAAAELIRFALEEGAYGIALTSHGRKGAARVILGSFAESLVLQSPVPILVTSPKSHAQARTHTVVFPTDFSETSRLAFDRTLDWAKQAGASLILVHKFHLFYPEIGNVSPNGTSVRDPVQTAREEVRKWAAAWVKDARREGVDARAHLDFKPGRTLNTILKVAEGAGPGTLIAMSSASGPLRAVLVGSLSRQVLRHSPCPVLVFHVEQESRARAFLAQATRLALAYSANPPIR